MHAFEPNPDAYRKLAEVTSGYPNVVLHQAAVTTEPGDVQLYLHKYADDDPEYWSSGSSLLAEKSNVREDNAVTVEGIHLAAFIKQLGKPVKLLKMDIEGSEFDVISTLHPLCAKRIRQLSLETHGDYSKQLRIVRLLRNLTFNFIVINNH